MKQLRMNIVSLASGIQCSSTRVPDSGAITQAIQDSSKSVCEKRNKCERRIQTFISFSRDLQQEARFKRVSDADSTARDNRLKQLLVTKW